MSDKSDDQFGVGGDIATQWADDYEPGTELFCGTFAADDFDDFYGTAHPDNTTLAVRRCVRRPPAGWIRQHINMSDMERTFKLLEMHASDRALEILDSLKQEAWDSFVEAWGADAGLVEGKSGKSSTPAGSKKTQ